MFKCVLALWEYKDTSLCHPEHRDSSVFAVSWSYKRRIFILLHRDSSSSASHLDVRSNVSPNQRQGEPKTTAPGSTQSSLLKYINIYI